jgi:hypothetical protein
MASSVVGKGVLCFRTINIIPYSDGNDVNICMRKSRLVISLSVWSSRVR